MISYLKINLNMILQPKGCYLAHLVASKWPGAPVGGSGDPLEDFCKTNPADEECKVYEA